MKSIYVLSKLTNLKKKYRQESGRKKKERERKTGDIVQIVGERENQSECERVKE